LEPGQQFDQEHSGCVEDDLFEISEDYGTELGVYASDMISGNITYMHMEKQTQIQLPKRACFAKLTESMA